ncbi:MAG: Gfo/Idh/MocA family oxidoreductase [Gemmatimonadetes bacterium]|jgi:predicted dehydrogenase|nr:Gfo/Idh/MocA family oxidoreductase [Gemmatimonadota bacterium]MDE0964589.1 Gfo/Idh/MocA family oxidoreductase [Candidatus Latescibacterota bacterium]MBT5328004.1 Gfo/Idh/MocA family oxidoreductase [Gemmatimonadota bacterium]MBT5452023.1 Gfo/Idh/MocA family oxidoreductase [Gemmatimonadota bacterium]MBT5801299.1 Gfo/Idh/MocA family oxidoreductase [Gemmatimonadota bacterium]
MANYRGAVIGCGRIGSTIDDEHIDRPQFRYPWAHAPAIIEAKGVDLVAAADLMPEQLQDFKRRWGTEALYTDYREMIAKEAPDIVSISTRAEERAEVVINVAQAGVKVIYATKPMCRSLAEADAMIEACRRTNTVLAIACHKNWSPWFQACLQAIKNGEIGAFSSMVCNYSWSLSRGHSHTLGLFRMFAGAPAKWVFGHMNSDEAAAGDGDLSGTGMIYYENGMRAFLNTGGWLNIDFVGSDGWISARNEHADFEMWSRLPSTGEPVRRQFPNPKRPKSSQQAAIEGLVKNLDEGTAPLCSGEYGREALEIAIALRESHRRGGEKIELPLQERALTIIA